MKKWVDKQLERQTKIILVNFKREGKEKRIRSKEKLEKKVNQKDKSISKNCKQSKKNIKLAKIYVPIDCPLFFITSSHS